MAEGNENPGVTKGEEGVDWEWVDCSPDCPDCFGEGIHGDGKAVKILNEDTYSGQTDSTFSNQACLFSWVRDVEVCPEHRETRDVAFAHTVYEPEGDVITWSENRMNIHRAHGYGYKDVAEANNPKNMVFKLVYTQEETDMIGNAKVDILTYAKEMRAKFISGELDVNDNAEWQKYVDNIHKLGWDDAIAASQAAWARMNGK